MVKACLNHFLQRLKQKAVQSLLLQRTKMAKQTIPLRLAHCQHLAQKKLVVFGYLDQGGKGIVQASLDSGAFSKFIFADGMIGQALVDSVGDDLIGSFGTAPGGDNDGAAMFLKLAAGKVAGDGKGPFDGNSYDAAALIVLAMQAAGSSDRAAIQSKNHVSCKCTW